MELSEYLLFIKARYYDCDLIHIYPFGWKTKHCVYKKVPQNNARTQ